MLIQVQRDEAELRALFATELGFARRALRLDGEPLELDSYQQEFLADRSTFRWIVKARQVGYSFVFALESLVRCHLQRNHTAIILSFNHQDAVEKVRLARQLYDEMPAPYRKRLVTDTRTQLEFETNSGTTRGRSRIVSLPSKPPRGKHGSVYLDELAHYQDAKAVYAGTTAAIARAKGQLTAASTPLGRRGLFWEVCAEEGRSQAGHSRQAVPWWLCRFFCVDVQSASIEAPLMDTQRRVEQFATEALRQQFESLDLLAFQQEFEVSFIAERLSFFPYDLILSCTVDDLELASDWHEVPVPTGRLVAGFDVGRHRDRSELALFEERDGGFACRMLRTFDRAPFAEQEGQLRQMLEVLPIARLSIDSGGIGMNLAENLSRDYPQVVSETFTPGAKERWATELKILLQRRAVELPRDRDLVAQIHAIERRVTDAGRVTFGAPTTAKGHADRFWAIALACQKERALAPPLPEVQVIILGDGDKRRDRQAELVGACREFWGSDEEERRQRERGHDYRPPDHAPLKLPSEPPRRLTRKQRRELRS